MCFLQCSILNSTEQLQTATIFVPYRADSPPMSDSAVIYFIIMKNSSINTFSFLKLAAAIEKTPFHFFFSVN